MKETKPASSDKSRELQLYLSPVNSNFRGHLQLNLDGHGGRDERKLTDLFLIWERTEPNPDHDRIFIQSLYLSFSTLSFLSPQEGCAFRFKTIRWNTAEVKKAPLCLTISTWIYWLKFLRTRHSVCTFLLRVSFLLTTRTRSILCVLYSDILCIPRE